MNECVNEYAEERRGEKVKITLQGYIYFMQRGGGSPFQGEQMDVRR